MFTNLHSFSYALKFVFVDHFVRFGASRLMQQAEIGLFSGNATNPNFEDIVVNLRSV